MTGTLTSATVGIQDASKTAGLQVAFNQAYIHDNLAVRIAATPQWLTAAPSSGRLHAGESIPINVHMNASGLEGGTYPGTVSILTNDPAQPDIPVAGHAARSRARRTSPSSRPRSSTASGSSTTRTRRR